MQAGGTLELAGYVEIRKRFVGKRLGLMTREIRAMIPPEAST